MIAQSSSLALMAGMIVALCVTPATAAVTISAAATANMNCVSGVCTPTARKAVLNVGDLTTMLGSGNVVVNTGAGLLAQQVKDIVVAASFNWANASSLTLDAYDSVTVNQPVAVNGSGIVVLTTDDGGTKGALSFGKKGSISFLSTSNSVTINGAAYTLVNSIAALAQDIAANPAGTYAFACNYDASQDGIYGTAPIPTTLTGTVQGLGNTISHLTIRDHTKLDQIGLFRTVGSSGTIANLRLANVDFAGLNKSINGGGGLAYINEGLLFGDQVSGKFGGRNGCCFWGGLAATNEGNIVQSSADVHITSSRGAGGLVGDNDDGTISLSSASGSIEGYGWVGGLVGVNEGIINESFATASVMGGDQAYAGGLIGNDESRTSNSYATGAVTAGQTPEVGGLDGWATAIIRMSYSTGQVGGGTGGAVGGLIGGDEDSRLLACIWDTTTSGTDEGTGNGNVKGLTGLTTQQLQSGLPSGFDATIWAENPKINGGLPYLINNPPPNN